MVGQVLGKQAPNAMPCISIVSAEVANVGGTAIPQAGTSDTIKKTCSLIV